MSWIRIASDPAGRSPSGRPHSHADRLDLGKGLPRTDGNAGAEALASETFKTMFENLAPRLPPPADRPARPCRRARSRRTEDGWSRASRRGAPVPSYQVG